MTKLQICNASLLHTFTALGFSWRYATNSGVMLSFLNQAHPLLILSIQCLVIITICRSDLPRMPKLLILSGGLSNIIDRYLYGHVIDYISFEIFHIQWPAIINIADIYVSLGLLLWIFSQSQDINNTGIFAERAKI